METQLDSSLRDDAQHAELPVTAGSSAAEPSEYRLAEPEPETVTIPEPPVQEVAKQVGDVATDAARLVELQAKLFQVELRQSALNMIQPVGIIGVAAVVMISAFILFLFGLGTGLHDLTGMPLSVAQLIVAVLGLAGAAAAGYSAFGMLKEPRISFAKSKEELMRNIQFFSSKVKAK